MGVWDGRRGSGPVETWWVEQPVGQPVGGGGGTGRTGRLKIFDQVISGWSVGDGG